MRKLWCVIGMMGLALSACTTQQETQPSTPTQPAYTGPVVEISGAEPRYEPYNPGNMQDYEVNGKRYSIVKNPQNFSQTGLAAWYDSESSGNSRTASGEPFDAYALAAVHPTLPLPSYVRVTNLSNGRQLVVRVNDRGPYTPGRIIDLTRAAADRLNISNNTKVRVDFIQVAPDGTLTGPGTVGTVVAKQSFALPPRPDLSVTGASGDSGAALSSGNGATMVGNSGAAVPAATGSHAGANGALLSADGRFMVQVGAIGDAQRAANWQKSLSNRFSVPGRVSANGNLFRVQLGPFQSRQQAQALVQRLQSEAQQQAFITAP